MEEISFILQERVSTDYHERVNVNLSDLTLTEVSFLFFFATQASKKIRD